MPTPAYLLIDPQRVLDTLGFDVADAAQTPAVTLAVGDASFLVIRRCRRVFGAVVATKRFDLPYGPYLPVPDLQSVSTLLVNGTPLTEGTDYDLQPANLTDEDPVYHQVRRLFLADLSSWWSDGQAGTRWQGAAIAGVWGFPTPDPVGRVVEALAVRIWNWRNMLYGLRSGATALGAGDLAAGLFTPDMDVMLQDYKLPAPVVT